MSRKPINSGLLVTIGLPLFAILASVGVAVVALTRGDPTLPDEYHWEGMSLDRDFADAHRASELKVHATLRMLSPTGMCQVALNLGSATPPVKEMIRDGENGLLADFFDAEQIARRAVEVLRDPAAFRMLGRAAEQTIIGQYSLEVVLPKMIELYEQVRAFAVDPANRVRPTKEEHPTPAPAQR